MSTPPSASPPPEGVTPEEFRLMAQRAGLGLTDKELEDLKPLYDINLEHIQLLHSVDLRAEEIEVAFRPDWPEQET